MTTRLHIGITQYQTGWDIVLSQIGVEWSVLPATSVPEPELYSTIIMTAPLSPTQHKALLHYAELGGALVDAVPSGFRRPVRTLYPSSADTLFGYLPLIDVYGFVRSYRSPLLAGTVAIEDKGQGLLARLGIDVARAVVDTRKKRKRFYAPSRRFPNEMVSLVSKGALRMAVATLLKELHFRRGLPFVHRRLFPGTMPTIFCFRIDSDGGSRQQVQTWCDIATRHGVPMSWYLHLEHHAAWLDVLSAYPEQELGIHSVVHKTYQTFEENSENIARARAILDAEHIRYTGYAAPYGTWNTGVARAEEYHGFAYASEFSLSYDDVPFFPAIDNRLSPVLQVPIHPICLGSLGRVGMSEEEMHDYNSFAVYSKLCDGEPLIFYDHPLHPYTGALDALFALVRGLGIPALSFADYAAWWKRRLSSSQQVYWRNGAVEATESSSANVLSDVWHSHEHHSILLPNGSLHPSVRLHSQRPVANAIRDIRRFSKEVLRQDVVDAINKWRVR